jgi:hypothetical protein
MQVDNVALFGALDATYVTSGQRLPVTYTHTLARGHTHTHTQTRSTTLPAACSNDHTGRDSTRRVCIGTDHNCAEHADDAFKCKIVGRRHACRLRRSHSTFHDSALSRQPFVFGLELDFTDVKAVLTTGVSMGGYCTAHLQPLWGAQSQCPKSTSNTLSASLLNPSLIL